MPANRNTAIDKAIQPMLQMLEQRSQARQQVAAAESEQQKAQLLEQLLPMQMQGASKDYKEARAVEKAKGVQAGQAKGGKQPTGVPKMQPMNAGDPTSGLGTDAASRLEGLIAGGPQPAAGGDRAASSGAPDPVQGQSIEQARKTGMPGQTISGTVGKPENMGMQILRAQLGMGQPQRDVVREDIPSVKEYAEGGAMLAEPALIKDEGADPMQDPEFKAWAQHKIGRFGEEMGGILINEAVGKAQKTAGEERRIRALNADTQTKQMIADGAGPDAVDMWLEGDRAGSLALTTKARLSYESIAEATARADLDNRKLTNQTTELRVAALAELRNRRTFFSYVNPSHPLAGPSGARERTDAIALGMGAPAGATGDVLAKDAWKTWTERKGMIGSDQVLSTQFLKQHYSQYLAGAEMDLEMNGRVPLVDHDAVFYNKENPDMVVMDVPDLVGDVTHMLMAVQIGGFTYGEFLDNTERGQSLADKLDRYGYKIDPDDGSLFSDRNSPMTTATGGMMGAGMGPLKDQVGLGISRIAEDTIALREDVRSRIVEWSVMPYKNFEEKMTPEYWQKLKKDIVKEEAVISNAQAAEVAKEQRKQEAVGLFYRAPISAKTGGVRKGSYDVPTEGDMTWPSMVGGVPVGDLNISSDEFDAIGKPKERLKDPDLPPWAPENVVGKSEEAQAAAAKFMKALSEGAIPPMADKKIRKLLGME